MIIQRKDRNFSGVYNEWDEVARNDMIMNDN
jgi:hypothetical protein